jgi:hypothetical protein
MFTFFVHFLIFRRYSKYKIRRCSKNWFSTSFRFWKFDTGPFLSRRLWARNTISTLFHSTLFHNWTFGVGPKLRENIQTNVFFEFDLIPQIAFRRYSNYCILFSALVLLTLFHFSTLDFSTLVRPPLNRYWSYWSAVRKLRWVYIYIWVICNNQGFAMQ